MESAHSSGGAVHAPLSESEFLRLEADKAKASIGVSLDRAKVALSHGLDPTVPLRRHPLITLVAATAAGFIATVVAVPSKHERALRELERLNRAMHPQPAPSTNGAKPSNGPSEDAKIGLLAYLLKEVLSFARPILVSQITARLKNEAKPADPQRPPA